jgi:uncharacterized linocin/CFP29 family protein
MLCPVSSGPKYVVSKSMPTAKSTTAGLVGMTRAASMEDSSVAEVLLNGGKMLKASSWDVPGSAVAEVAKAMAELYRAYAPEPYVPFVGPGRYAKLVAVEKRTGVMELTR